MVYEIRMQRSEVDVYGIPASTWNKIGDRNGWVYKTKTIYWSDNILQFDIYTLPIDGLEYNPSIQLWKPLPYEVWEVHEKYKRRVA